MVNNYPPIKYASIVLAFLICGIFAADFYVKNFDTLRIKEKMKSKISDVSLAETNIENLYLALLPYPKLTLKRVTINKGIFIDKIEIEPDYLSLIKGTIQEGSANISNAYINPRKTGIKDKSFGNIIDSIFKMESSLKKIKITKVWDTAIKNRIIISDLLITKKSRSVFTEFNFSNDIKFKDSSIYNSKDDKYNSETSIKNPNFTFISKRSFSNDGVVAGNFFADIKNTGAFTSSLSSYFNFIFNSYFKSTKPLKISGEITSDNNYVILNDIKVKSESVDIYGSYWMPKNNDINFLDLHIKKLDLLELSKGPDLNYDKDESITNLDASKLKIQIQGEDISFLGDNISKFVLLGVGDGKNFNIQNCTGNIGTEGGFSITGSLSDNKFRPKFVGNIDISHNNFNKLITNSLLSSFATDISSQVNISSKLSVTPIDVMFKDFKLIIGGQNIRGNANFKFSGNDNLLLADLDIDDLDLDQPNLPIVKNIYDYFKSLGKNMSDKAYASKYLALRTYPLKTSINIVGDNIVAEGTTIDRLSLVSSFEPGILRFDNFMLNFGDTFFAGNARIQANSLKPQIKFNITDGQVITGSISKSFFEGFLKYLNQDVNLSDLDISSDINLDKIKQGTVEITNLNASLESKNGSISLPKMHFNLFGADATLTGSFVINPIKSSLAFGFDGIKLSDVTKIFKEPIALQDGFISINGQISATGADVDQILYNTFVQGNYLAKDLVFKDIDIEDAIIQLSSQELTSEKADNIIYSNSNSGKTIFAEASGPYELNNGILTLKDILLTSKFFTASAGLALNTYDHTIDLNSIFSFYPIGAKIFSPSSVTPIKLRLISKGSIFGADKLLKFDDKNDIYRIPKLLNSPAYVPPR